MIFDVLATPDLSSFPVGQSGHCREGESLPTLSANISRRMLKDLLLTTITVSFPTPRRAMAHLERCDRHRKPFQPTEMRFTDSGVGFLLNPESGESNLLA
ncbi:MAG: hypothetical protein RLP02_27725 [Coleofasciculus sp. C2-GNP5-27]